MSTLSPALDRRGVRPARSLHFALALGVVSAALIAAAPAQAQSETTKKVGKVFRLFGLGSTPPEEANGKPVLTSCPEIVVDGGTFRSPAGADAASVRYQIGIGETARECILEGERVVVKVGVEGAVTLGPLGQPGAYYGNLRMSLRLRGTDKIVVSKVYRVGASIPGGASRADYQVVSDPLAAPYANADAADDYEVLLSFASEGADVGKPHKSRRSRRP